jgi:hypothetical protein
MREPDCVRWKRAGAEMIQEETQGLSREQLVGWWAKRTAELEKRIAKQRPAGKQAET